MELFNHNDKYEKKVLESSDYLNEPTFLYNTTLFQLARNSRYSYGERVEHIAHFIAKYGEKKGLRVAEQIVKQYEDMPINVFTKQNINHYLPFDKIEEYPIQVQRAAAKHEAIYEAMKPIWGWNEWAVGIKFDKNTYRYAN